jgi:hypothetical protein
MRKSVNYDNESSGSSSDTDDDTSSSSSDSDNDYETELYDFLIESLKDLRSNQVLDLEGYPIDDINKVIKICIMNICNRNDSDDNNLLLKELLKASSLEYLKALYKEIDKQKNVNGKRDIANKILSIIKDTVNEKNKWYKR